MRRARILVLLLCAFALTAPLVSRAAASNDGGECKAGFCGSDSQCPGGVCHKNPGQTCGVCVD